MFRKELRIRFLSPMLLILAVALGCGDRPAPSPDHAITGETMGTTYTVKLAALPDGIAPKELKAEIDRRLERINDQMSTYREDSELSRFNQYERTDWFDVSPETAQVVAEARRVGDLSGGAFDATVMPLVNLWSFGPAARPNKVPSEEEIARAKAKAGYERVEVRLDPPALRKTRADVTLDLSAIAKGFGVDRVAESLDHTGIGGYMVEIGGEVRTKGTKADGTMWRIGIQSPAARRPAVHKRVALGGQALATSGDYRNYFEQDGRRYSHTIDPRTGRPIEHRLASVSVVTETCMEADALATALMVLGPDEAYNLARRENLAALLLVHDGENFVERATPEFERLLADDKGATMKIFLLALAAFLIAMTAMAVGVIVAGRRLKGSCGGIANLRDEHGDIACMVCSTPSESCSGRPDEADARDVEAESDQEVESPRPSHHSPT